MSDKRGDGAAKALSTAAALGAAYGSRKLITVGWKRFTGKEPPADPQDPAVTMAEALGWAVVMGMVMGAARVLAVRMANGALRRSPDKAASAD
jgi:Protein of unknown function (DUF4235)